MKRALIAVLFSALSAPIAAQMMGSAISTSPYFPLVEGARYDYVFSRGSWATSTVTVRTGQTWAGQPGLAAMHTNYVCNVGVSCSTDATDFYRMDGDGMRYFGGMGANPAGTSYSMMTYTDAEWMLKNPLTPGSMMNGGYSNAEMWRAGVMGSGSMMGTQNYTSSYYAQALETVTTPAGSFTNALHIREQRGSGYTRDVWYAAGVGMIRYDDADASAVLSGYSMPNAPAQGTGVVPAMPFMPTTGLWWNPDESGSGYNIQMQHGVMAVTMFAYAASGEPMWYLGVGRPVSTGTGMSVTASLDRYSNGQCASCPYRSPAQIGSDGTFTMTFASPNDATLQLPGGRTTRIRPMAW